MKRKYFTGFGAVFGFTLSRQLKSKQYIALTLIFAVLFFGGVSAIVVLPQVFGGTDEDAMEITLERVIFCDMTDTTGGGAWLAAGGEPFGNIIYEEADTVERAHAAADAHTLILLLENADGAYSFRVITPDGTALTDKDTGSFISYVNGAFRAELIRRSGIDPTVLAELVTPVAVGSADTSEPSGEGDTVGDARETVNMAMSYILIFLMYMMVLMYGQGAAMLVILEKTSKLMDYFLVSVKPASMILGKVLASAVSALLQVAAWLLSVILGLRFGIFAAKAMFGAASPALTEMLELTDGLWDMLNPGGVIIALLVMIAGFLLYCSMAAIGGAMASKPEDLASTNIIFTMSIVVSFLLSLYSGSSNGLVSTSEWLVYFPFTALLVTPGRALTGSISLLEGTVSVILVAATAFLFTIIAGKAYEMMTFYRGDPPKPTKLISMLRDFMKKKQDT